MTARCQGCPGALSARWLVAPSVQRHAGRVCLLGSVTRASQPLQYKWLLRLITRLGAGVQSLPEGLQAAAQAKRLSSSSVASPLHQLPNLV